MLKKIIIMTSLAICGGCVTSEKSKNTEISDRDIRIDKVVSIIEEYEKKIKKIKKIQRRLYGFNWTGSDKIYDGKIHGITRGYSVDNNLKYYEARKLYYEIADGLIQAINSHPEIGGEFYHYPIGYQDLEVGLSFDYENKGHLKKNDIDSIYIENNEILYFVVDQGGVPDELEKKWILPNVYKTEGFGSKSHCIRRKLPEKDDDIVLKKQ